MNFDHPFGRDKFGGNSPDYGYNNGNAAPSSYGDTGERHHGHHWSDVNQDVVRQLRTSPVWYPEEAHWGESFGQVQNELQSGHFGPGFGVATFQQASEGMSAHTAFSAMSEPERNLCWDLLKLRWSDSGGPVDANTARSWAGDHLAQIVDSGIINENGAMQIAIDNCDTSQPLQTAFSQRASQHLPSFQAARQYWNDHRHEQLKSMLQGALQGDRIVVLQNGDTLSGLQKQYGVSYMKIFAANPGIADVDKIFAGLSLRIPQA